MQPKVSCELDEGHKKEKKQGRLIDISGQSNWMMLTWTEMRRCSERAGRVEIYSLVLVMFMLEMLITHPHEDTEQTTGN